MMGKRLIVGRLNVRIKQEGWLFTAFVNYCRRRTFYLVGACVRAILRCCVWWAPVAFIAGMGCASQPPKSHLGCVFEAQLGREERPDYAKAVTHLLAAYEASGGLDLTPGKLGRVALKVDVEKGAGLSTPLLLIRAMVEALEQRSFKREQIYLVAHSARLMQRAGLVATLGQSNAAGYAGCSWRAWDQGGDYDADWYYDSPLPPRAKLIANWEWALPGLPLRDASAEMRKSLLPVSLLFDFDYWINLATVSDAPGIGVQGVLANATLANVSNSGRFIGEPVAASAAIAEIAAIPEFSKAWRLNLISLNHYQFIGGPEYNAAYTRSEPLLWLSTDPVALDRLLVERINRARRQEGFSELKPLPLQLNYAASLQVGTDALDAISIVDVMAF